MDERGSGGGVLGREEGDNENLGAKKGTIRIIYRWQSLFPFDVLLRFVELAFFWWHNENALYPSTRWLSAFLFFWCLLRPFIKRSGWLIYTIAA